MGQYYRIVIRDKNGIVHYNSRKVKDCVHIFGKLMEHSYFDSAIMNAVANFIEKNGPCKLMWVGDYAEKKAVDDICNCQVNFDAIWNDDVKFRDGDNACRNIFDNANDYKWDGKYLVNHTKKMYISFTDYMRDMEDDICPLSLLTAVGNGCGGGDYCGSSQDMVGKWAWDEISIETDKPNDDFIELKDLCFQEE